MVLRAGRRACLAACRPRARGDGPCRCCCARSPETSAPRTRGWSWVAVTFDDDIAVGPAHAGMVLDDATRRYRRTGRPRARGDGPSPPNSRTSAPRSAPRTRGWSPEGPLTGSGRSRLRGCGWSAPRTRGWSDMALAVDPIVAVGPRRDDRRGDRPHAQVRHFGGVRFGEGAAVVEHHGFDVLHAGFSRPVSCPLCSTASTVRPDRWERQGVRRTSAHQGGAQRHGRTRRLQQPGQPPVGRGGFNRECGGVSPGRIGLRMARRCHRRSPR